jgi:hypothetical protein
MIPNKVMLARMVSNAVSRLMVVPPRAGRSG